MSPRRTKRLLKDVKAWLKATGTKQIDLARMLGISPQGLTNILKNRAEPTGEQALALSEIISLPPKQ
jgi:transcriptional regulator with XRE-family HTH domain